jgi:hypothetical protein
MILENGNALLQRPVGKTNEKAPHESLRRFEILPWSMA